MNECLFGAVARSRAAGLRSATDRLERSVGAGRRSGQSSGCARTVSAVDRYRRVGRLCALMHAVEAGAGAAFATAAE